MANIEGIPPVEEMNEKQKLALVFAKALASQTIHDPSGKTSKRKNRKYSTPTKADIEGYLQSPSTNEKNLRNSSIYLYQINPRYRNLLNYYSSIPRWFYTISPVNYNPDRVRKEALTKQYQKVCNVLESIGVEKTMREIVVAALREGVYYGCIWGGNGDSFILQKLDPDNCVLSSIGDGGVFQFQYDMSKVEEDDLKTYYPPAFTEMYREYQRSGNQWQPVPPEISVCFKADPSIVEYSIPTFAGTFPTLFELENVQALSETSAELSNYKLIAGTIPTDEEGVPLVDYETVMQYYQHLSNNVGDRVGVALTPFELESFNFDQSAAAAQVDAVARASENYFSEAGSTALLHGATNNTSGVTKLAIKVDEAFSFGLMYQCERIINKFLKTLSGTVKFKVHFLEISCFNVEEKLESLRSAMNYGVGKLEYIVANGIRQHDILGENFVENEILDLNNLLVPVKTASTRSAEESEVGRPKSSDGDISDAGESTRDGDANDNR